MKALEKPKGALKLSSHYDKGIPKGCPCLFISMVLFFLHKHGPLFLHKLGPLFLPHLQNSALHHCAERAAGVPCWEATPAVKLLGGAPIRCRLALPKGPPLEPNHGAYAGPWRLYLELDVLLLLN